MGYYTGYIVSPFSINQMKRFKNILFFTLIIFLCSSCMFDSHYFEESVSYRVEASELYIRYSPSPSAMVIGTLKKGDTITSKSNWENWKKVYYKGSMAYVDSTYLTRLVRAEDIALELKKETYSSIGIFSFIDKYSHWNSWKFWVLTIVLLFISLMLYIFGASLIKGSDAIERWVDLGFTGMNFLPFAAIIIGAFFGIAYFFYPKDVQIAIYVDNIWAWPAGKGFLYWYLWLLIYTYSIITIILVIYDLVIFRLFGFVRIIYFLLTCSFVFLTMVFVANASILILIFIVVINFSFAILSPSPPQAPIDPKTAAKKERENQRLLDERHRKEEAREFYLYQLERERDKQS